MIDKEIISWFERNSYKSVEGDFWVNELFVPVPRSINKILKELDQDRFVRNNVGIKNARD